MVTAQGQLRFAAGEGRFTADSFINLCKRLLRDADGPVFLIVDGHSTHRAKKVKAFVESTDGRLCIFTLPGYSPEPGQVQSSMPRMARSHSRGGKTQHAQ